MAGRDRGRRFGLVIRSGPFTGRSARDQLDLALTAATLDFDLELFFIGDAVQQLLPVHDPHAAGLPRGSRGWASLPALTRVQAYATPQALRNHGISGAELALHARPLEPAEMADRLAQCDRVLVD
jgi:sulfur relay protein TusC/DsrF